VDGKERSVESVRTFVPGFNSLKNGERGSYRVAAPAFFLAAHLAFIRAANFLRAAGLIGFRAGAIFVGADLPKRFAHRSFIAADIRLRAAGLIVRVPDPALAGRPRRGLDPSRAAMA
jgi:hypothetical protein